MKIPLFSELTRLYQTSREKSNVIRMEIRLRDAIDGESLRRAVYTTMKRYPYFAVMLQKEGNAYVFRENGHPVTVSDSEKGVPLNSPASGFHLLAFAWQECTIYVDVFHALTDGTGMLELIRTLLYYYCSDHYHVQICTQGIRLVGDRIPPEEWEDPALGLEPAPPADAGNVSPALNLTELCHARGDRRKMLFGITMEESAFIRFCKEHDSSPGTMTVLLLSRAIESVHPDIGRPVRICLCVNQRKALRAPKAHQSLVGGVWLEYRDRIRNWPLTRQATAFRGMVFAQTMDENVIASQQALNRKCRVLQSLETDEERVAFIRRDDATLSSALTATVSYIGKADLGDVESYITGFRTLAYPMVEGILVEISAVNHRITLDFMQNFSTPVYLEAFLRILQENGIPYQQMEGKPLYIPGVELPWLS
ncbi:MAG: hypothetical protein IJ088_13140 [Clostridia bacterium]|nr:hypothetical protein [Clostridia bacterium]